MICQHHLFQETIEPFIAWTREIGISYGLVSSHAATLSEKNPLVNQAIDVIYPNLAVNPDFYQKELIYQL